VNQKSAIVDYRNADIPFIFCRLGFAPGHDFLRVGCRQTHFVAHWFSFFQFRR